MKIEDVPENLPIKGANLQRLLDLKKKFKTFPMPEFYKKYVSKKYHQSHRLAVFLTSSFGSTYLCEQAFFRISHIKYFVRSLIYVIHMEYSLRIATNITKFASEE